MMATRYDADFQTALEMMESSDSGPFMAALVDLLTDLHREHQPDEGGSKCKSSGCECWSDPDFSIDWPCAWWMNAHRVAVAWLLERATGAQSPEERQREAARARKARQRQREREGQESAEPQVDASCPEGTDGGLPEGREAGAQAGPEASALAPAKRMPRQVP